MKIETNEGLVELTEGANTVLGSLNGELRVSVGNCSIGDLDTAMLVSWITETSDSGVDVCCLPAKTFRRPS